MEDIWDESASVPFWGTVGQLEKLSELVGHCVETVTQSSSPREMVLETWLAVDYAVRDLIVGGYQLARFCQEGFDLRYILLPKSFEELLRLLEQTVSFQTGLGPEPPITPDDYPSYIRSTYDFLKYLAENHGDINERLKEIEAEYFAKRHPELAEQIKQGYKFCFIRKERTLERLPSGWVQVVNNLGDDWFSLARQLNNARNKAAHSYDSSAIAKAFGIAGPQAVDMVRSKCLELLKKLLGISLDAHALGKSG